MKQKGFSVLVCALIFSILVMVFYPQQMNVKPFENLSADDISNVTVQVLSQNASVQIEEMDEVIDALNDVVTNGRDSSHSQYITGQSVLYTITLSDGNTIVVNACNPYLFINEVGYRGEGCEKLLKLANRLVGNA